MSERRERAHRIMDAQIHLLDRQVLDVHDVPITAVDDLELSDVPRGAPIPEGTPAPVIENLLSGAVLGTRIFGGRPPAHRWHRVPWKLVRAVDSAVHVRVEADELEASWPERWIREHVIGRIPGGSHDPEADG